MEIFQDEILRPDLTNLTLNNNCLLNTLDNTKNVLNISYTINYSKTNDLNYNINSKRTNTRFITGALSIPRSTDKSLSSLTSLCNQNETCRGFDLDGYLYSKISYPLDNQWSDGKIMQGMRIRQGGTPVLGNYIYKNSLNFTNVNTPSIDGCLIFSYISVPTTQLYKFRIRSGTISYNFPCKIYLNNYQNIILNSFSISGEQSTLQQESNYNILNAGIYLICIDLPLPANTSANSSVNTLPTIPFTLEFAKKDISTTHPDLLSAPLSTDWNSCDNLLIKSCNNLLTKPSQLIDLFFTSSINYCNDLNNRNSKNCIDFYNSIEDNIYNEINDSIRNSNYPIPIDGQYSNWTISDIDWNKNMKNLANEYGKCGKQVIRSRSRDYKMAKNGGININNPEIIQSQIQDINCQTDDYTKTQWNNLGCNTNIIPTSIIDAQFNPDRTILDSVLNNYSKNSLKLQLNNLTQNIILNDCYNDWINNEVSSFTLSGGEESGIILGNAIYTNVCYTNGYTWNNIGMNKLNKLVIQSDGDLVLYNQNNIIVWRTGTNGNNGARLCATRTGRLVIYNINKEEIWSYDCNKTMYSSDINTFYKISTDFNNIIAFNSINSLYGNNVDRLYPGFIYRYGYTIKSNNEKFTLQLGSTNNLIILQTTNLTNSIWKDSYQVNSNNNIIMQTDGNLVIYLNGAINGASNALWSTNTSGNIGSYCQLLDNGCLVIKKLDNTIINCINPIDSNNNAKIRRDIIFSSGINYLNLKGGEELCISDKSVMYAYIRYSNNFTWINNNYQLRIWNDGDFLLKLGTTNIWRADETSSNWVQNSYIAIESDGELVLRNPSGQILWRSYFNNLTYMPEVKLINKGYLIINNNNGNIARSYPIDVIEKYLMKVHWDGSPWVLFSDYRPGAVYWAKWSDLDKDLDISKLSNDGTKSDYIRFYGIRKDSDDSTWNVIESDITNPLGYKQTLINGVKPDQKNDSSNNWNRTTDAQMFYNNQNRYASCPKIIYPTQIPGYDRISQVNNNPSSGSDTSKFLISTRGTGKFDQAFVLYKIKPQNNDYAKDIITNNKTLVYNIIMNSVSLNSYRSDLNNPLDYISKDILGLDVDKWSYVYRDWLLQQYLSGYTPSTTSCVATRSSFLNKIHQSLPYNTNGKLIENFANVECNLNNIKTDKNCSGTTYNAYLNYLNNMGDYCSKNVLDPKCTEYIDKKFISKTDKTKIYQPYSDIKMNLLSKQESNCEIENNYLNDRCITINSNKPEILKKQQQSLNKDSDTYKQLEQKYGDKFLFTLCMTEQNIINKDNIDKCNELIKKNNNYSPILKDHKIEICNKDVNLLNSECLRFNKQEQLKEIKNKCKDNKTENCKKLCKEYKEDFSDICFWENNKIYFIILFIIIIFFGGGIFYIRKKKIPILKKNINQFN